jgi:hypothetical protein
MAEPSTSPLYEDLATEIQDSFPDITAAAKLGRIIKNAHTMLLYPPEVQIEQRKIAGYKWNWISPLDTLHTVVEYSTGTVTVAEGFDWVLLGGLGAAWPTWADESSASITITDALAVDHTFSIESRDSAVQITLASVWPTTGVAMTAYEIHYHPDYYDLPVNFGGLVGDRVFIASAQYYPPIPVRSVDEVAEYYLADQNPGVPRYACVMPADFVAATGQRYQMGLWPIPDDDYAIGYRYNVNLDAIAAGEYSAGGPLVARALKACCKAEAELLESGGAPGHYYQLAMQALAGAIAHDMDMKSRNIGPMQENSDARAYWSNINGTLSVNGVDVSI